MPLTVAVVGPDLARQLRSLSIDPGLVILHLACLVVEKILWVRLEYEVQHELECNWLGMMHPVVAVPVFQVPSWAHLNAGPRRMKSERMR